jgi:hypothetical protein
MQSILFITIGTRDVQLLVEKCKIDFVLSTDAKTIMHQQNADVKLDVFTQKEFPQYYQLVSPRYGGAYILDHFSEFKSVINFPVIEPLVHYLQENGILLSKIYLIATDQTEEKLLNPNFKEVNFTKDTFYTAQLVKQYLEHALKINAKNILLEVVTKNVALIEQQYDAFATLHNSLPSQEEVDKLYLYPQGGIDQINQALTLRLIEQFKEKVIQFQSAEGQPLKELYFVRRFINTLNKQKLLALVESYAFEQIDGTVTSVKNIKKLASLANTALSLNINKFNNECKNLLDPLPNTSMQQLKNLYCAIKIDYYNKRYKDFLYKIFTLAENIGKVELEQHWNIVIANMRYKKEGDTHNKWELFLNEKNLLEVLQQNKINTEFPNRMAYQFLLEHVKIAKPNFIQLLNAIELLANQRNTIAHNLSFVELVDIENELKKHSPTYNSIQLLSELDAYFNIKGLDIFDAIKNKIETLVNA